MKKPLPFRLPAEFDRRLMPLLLYRGGRQPLVTQRLFIFAGIMMSAGAKTLSDGVKLSTNQEYAHLGGPQSLVNSCRLGVFWLRLIDNPAVTDIVPGLTAYVREVARDTHWFQRSFRFGAPNRIPWPKHIEVDGGRGEVVTRPTVDRSGVGSIPTVLPKLPA